MEIPLWNHISWKTSWSLLRWPCPHRFPWCVPFFLSLSLSDDLLFSFFLFLIFSSLFGIMDLLFIVYCHKWWVPTSLLACTNTTPLFFVIYNTDVCVWFSLSPVNFAWLDQFFKIFFLFSFYLVRSLASYNSYDKLQSSFAQSLLSSPPIYLSLLFSHGSNAEPFLWKKKKNVESHCWDVARDSWRCESHTNTKTTMKYIWISLSKKKKKKCSTDPKRKIVVATSYLSKPNGQVWVIVLW